MEPEPKRRTFRPGGRALAIGLAGVAGLAALGIGIGFALEPGAAPQAAAPPPPADGTISIAVDKPVNEFAGNKALGAGVDGHEEGEIDQLWSSRNVAAMKSAGFGPLSFRLRTELGVEAWHWNPQGTWSEPGTKQGYWTSSSDPSSGTQKDSGVSYGYRLPRRGNTVDQARDDGYSRLDDDDPDTFWKSNPYLDPYFTGEPDSLHPQWIMVEFDDAMPVDSVRFDWGTPRAARFKVQYWNGQDAHFPLTGNWRDFPQAAHQGTDGTQTVRVSPKPLNVQFVRILLTEASNTAAAGARDIRDRLGYAVRELYVGQQTAGGFEDYIHHRPSHRQTTMWTSSTDPWHRASDLDKNYEHASFERVFASGITNGQPMMVPVPALYGTPEDAAGLVRYLRKRGYPVQRIEIGEEPDAQLVQPEHYAALYVQMARAMRAVDPSLQFGGPGYQTTLPDWVHWPDAKGVRSWTGRFVSYLRDHQAMDDFDFFSFEWYPFDDVCADPSASLAKNPSLLADLLAREEKEGLPPEVPKVITEYGYSAFAGEVEVDLPGAMVDAETAAMFLAMGGETSYYYGLEPNIVIQEGHGEDCHSWGNLMLFQLYDDGKIRPVAAYYAAKLVNQQWLQPGNGRHLVYTATSDVRNKDGQPLVTAYAVRRPDGSLGVLLFNKDADRTITVRLTQHSGGRDTALAGVLNLDQYSSEQYVWHSNHGHGNGGHPDPDDPPAHSVISADAGATVTLPPMSISVAVTQP